MKIKRYALFVLLISLLPLSSNAQVLVNEYSAANWRAILDYYQETEDWIEFYNPGPDPVNLYGYYLSDNKNKPTKWAFPTSSIVPAGGFLRVWCSGRDLKDPQGNIHTGFKLSQATGKTEHIVFSKPDGTLLEDIKIEETQYHQSRGRLTDGGNVWRIFTEVSPGMSNNGRANAIGFAPRPDMDLAAGFYPGPITVTITSSDPNAVIRYTTNGTEPTPASSIYSAPITVTQTTVIKAVGYSSDTLTLPSFTQFNTYFINETHTLAVVSVASNDVITLANGNQSLRPLGCIEYFNKAGERKARTYGELNSHGQDSWANDQRSLDWVSRDEMGYNGALTEKMIPLSPNRDKYQRIILRAAGDDNYPASHHPQNAGSAHIRDAYIHNLAKRGHMNLDVRAAEKCVVYLNGQYWGVYDIREIPDDHDYTDLNYNQGKFELQYVLTWGNTWASYGGQQAIDDWRAIRSYILNNSMNDSIKFQYVKDQYDYTSLVDYVIVNGFTVCTDWLNYNTGIWRGLNPEGSHKKWGYILWDNDATFDHYINYTGLPSTQPNAPPCDPEGLSGSSDPERHIRVLNKLRTNPEVRQYYISRMADMMYTVFGCENMLNYLDTIEATLDPEMARHALRWDGTYTEWKNNLDAVRDFINQRCNLLPTLMDDCYNVTGPFQATIMVDPPGAGEVKINTLAYAANQFPVTGQFLSGPDVDLLLHATPDTIPANPGEFRFSHWTAKNHSFIDPTRAKVALDLTTTDTIIAHFVTTTSSSVEPGRTGDSPSVLVTPTVFDQQLNVQYFLPEKMAVNISIFDLPGRQVYQQTVDAQNNMAGNNQLNINTRALQLPSGVYMLRFSAGSFEKTIKLVK